MAIWNHTIFFGKTVGLIGTRLGESQIGFRTVMSESGDLTACLITTRVEPPSSIILVFQVLKREKFAEGKYPANLAIWSGTNGCYVTIFLRQIGLSKFRMLRGTLAGPIYIER